MSQFQITYYTEVRVKVQGFFTQVIATNLHLTYCWTECKDKARKLGKLRENKVIFMWEFKQKENHYLINQGVFNIMP